KSDVQRNRNKSTIGQQTKRRQTTHQSSEPETSEQIANNKKIQMEEAKPRKEVIRCPDIEYLTEEELLEGLKEQKVVEVVIMKRKTEQTIRNTRTAIITFKTGKIPRVVDFGLYPVKVELYVPRPMRCITCMKLGHTKKWCQKEKICANCSEIDHKDQCKKTQCVSCGEAHHTLNRNCPVFVDEMEISRIKTEN
uniref:CCHC-type domain-containing protein n=1 Tax=Anopheles quadriannulatus TaxID=34691 RepID=A0A182X634_ANOQN